MTDSNKLKAKIIEKGYTQEIVANKLGISMASLNYKINNKRPFNSNEMFLLCDILDIKNPKQYFFTENVDEAATNINRRK